MPPDPFAKLAAIVQPCVPFTAEDGQSSIQIPLDCGGAFTVAVRSRAFHDWYFYQFYSRYDHLPAPREFRAVVDHLEAQANHYDERCRGLPVFRRVGRLGARRLPDRILLDLANPAREFVEISPDGWKTTSGPHALFRTSRSTLPLPVPTAPQSPTPNPQPLTPALDILRSCLNLPSRAAWLRCLAWLLSALRPSGPYPFLILQGPPSSGKSFAARVLRSLIDPCSSPLAATPSSTRDLVTLARHNWILAFDHISTISPLLADSLCRLSSGLGATLREAPGPAHEPLQQFYKRPIIITVTERWFCPADIAKRALIVTLPPLTSGIRSEDSLLAILDPARPAILGALCSAVSAALRYMPPSEMTQPLDWAIAASPALSSGEANVCTGEEMQLALTPPPPPHPIVEAVRNLIEQRKCWTGTATELRDLLQPSLPCHTPSSLSQNLRNSLLTLADHGIELKFRRLPGGARILDLRDELCDTDSQNHPQSASQNPDPFSQPKETEEVKTP